MSQRDSFWNSPNHLPFPHNNYAKQAFVASCGFRLNRIGLISSTRPYMKLMYMLRDTSDPYYQSVGSMSRDPYAGPYWRLFIERVPNHYNIAGLVGFIPSSRMPYDVIICVRNVYLLPQDGLAYPLPVVPDINQQDILTLRATTSGWN